MLFSQKALKKFEKQQWKKVRKNKAEPVPVLSLRGMILPEGFETPLKKEVVLPHEVYEKIQLIRDFSPKPKFVIVEINSPGGAITASSEISEAILRLGEDYHTIGWVRDVAASGGYEIACSCKEVVAHPTSLVGSIGVLFGSPFDFSDFIQKWEIHYRQLKAGPFKDIGSPFRKMEEEERKVLDTHLQEAHGYFKKWVQERRNLSEEELEKVANGLFWNGQQALGLKLVDKLGGLYEIQKQIEDEVQREAVLLFEKRESPGLLQQLFSFSLLKLFQSLGRKGFWESQFSPFVKAQMNFKEFF
ncbi:MAG: signal peptide peptidase SppA [Planctomycetota bacterium]|nr:MAG: signal peptide peptidase SppA [Planctomycetota bacterium]